MKNKRMVGTREREIKARTNLVLSFAPRTLLFLSKISLTTLRRIRKTRRRRRMMFRLMREIMRKLLANGDLISPKGNMSLKEEKEPDQSQEREK